MFGGQICVLMGLVVLLLFVPVLRCMISTKSNLFNNFVLLIMFKIFYVHFYRPMAIFVVCYTSLVVSVLPNGTRCYKKVLFCFPGTNPARCIN